jgi:hypothetical protein
MNKNKSTCKLRNTDTLDNCLAHIKHIKLLHKKHKVTKNKQKPKHFLNNLTKTKYNFEGLFITL